jgi:hypothetical protein
MAMDTNSVGVLRVFASLAMALLLGISAAPALAGDPVPGIDVSLEQIPGGVTRTTKTDSTGRYVFDRLPPGTYVLRLGPLNRPAPGAKAAENHNSSRSNPSRPLKGTEQYTVDIAVSSQVLPGKDPGTSINIGPQGSGRISGVAVKEEGVK